MLKETILESQERRKNNGKNIHKKLQQIMVFFITFLDYETIETE